MGGEVPPGQSVPAKITWNWRRPFRLASRMNHAPRLVALLLCDELLDFLPRFCNAAQKPVPVLWIHFFHQGFNLP